MNIFAPDPDPDAAAALDVVAAAELVAAAALLELLVLLLLLLPHAASPNAAIASATGAITFRLRTSDILLLLSPLSEIDMWVTASRCRAG
ncbi:MAG: hypothetical protein ABSH51_01990 [Solirubrobacteraceae bacterium]|jgi:hypothetical protein